MATLRLVKALSNVLGLGNCYMSVLLVGEVFAACRAARGIMERGRYIQRQDTAVRSGTCKDTQRHGDTCEDKQA